MKIQGLLFAAILAACVGCHVAVPGPDTSVKDQADIKALEDHFAAAFRAKDVNAIMANYVPDESLVVFDASPPRQYTGAVAYRKDFTDLFAAYPGPLDFSLTDLEVTTGGGSIAYSHSIQHLIARDKDGKATDMTVRVTDGYKKINGQWLISHEHVSVPVDFATMKPVLDSK